MKSYIATTTVAVLLTATTTFASGVAQQPMALHSIQSVTVQEESHPAVVSQATEEEKDALRLDQNDYTVDTMKYKGESIVFRSYEQKVYVAHPVDTTYQSMNIYVPEGYYEGKSINGYTAKTAPVFVPNTIGGYMPGKAGEPLEQDPRTGEPNAILAALAHGYVVASPSARGRTNVDGNGNYTGKAPACIVDMKAAIRYLRHNRDVIPGNMDKIVTNGTSAGGAVSALIGATGNNRDYEPYLRDLGAAHERDDVFASSVYCPITDLEHADMAYEWMFSHVQRYYQRNMNVEAMTTDGQGDGETIVLGVDGTNGFNENRIVQNRPDNAPTESTEGTELSDQQLYLAKELKKAFPKYVNSLHLKGPDGTSLTLKKNGDGPFKEYVVSLYAASAQSALNRGEDLSHLDWLTVENGLVKGVDLEKYATYATRLKGVPAFDDLGLESGENSEFGTATLRARHFTKLGERFSTVHVSGRASGRIVHMMNPLYYIGKKGTTVALHWRIRHGSVDRDTSLAVPAILALRLQNTGYDVDFAVPWNQGHGGDYDLDELFAWIDGILT